MVTDVAHQTIKAKIVTVLQGNSDIYESPPTSSAKFRVIQVGMPDWNSIADLPMPSCYVTSDERIIEEDTRSAPHSSGVSMGSTVIFRYLIIFVAQAKDAIRVEEKLDNFQKEIKETIKENPKFGDVGAVTTNPVLDDSWPEKTMVLNPNMLGKDMQGRIIQLWCKKSVS